MNFERLCLSVGEGQHVYISDWATYWSIIKIASARLTGDHYAISHR